MHCVSFLSDRSLLVSSSMTRPMTLVVTSGLWASQPLSWEMETLPSLKCTLWRCSLRSQGRTPDGALDSPVLHGTRLGGEAGWYAISLQIWESLIVKYVSFSKRRERTTGLEGHKQRMFLQDHTPEKWRERGAIVSFPALNSTPTPTPRSFLCFAQAEHRCDLRLHSWYRHWYFLFKYTSSDIWEIWGPSKHILLYPLSSAVTSVWKASYYPYT